MFEDGLLHGLALLAFLHCDVVQTVRQLTQLVLDRADILGVFLDSGHHLLLLALDHSLDLPQGQALQLVDEVLEGLHAALVALNLPIQVEDLLDDFRVQLGVAQDLLHAVDDLLGPLSHGQLRQLLWPQRG